MPRARFSLGLPDPRVGGSEPRRRRSPPKAHLDLRGEARAAPRYWLTSAAAHAIAVSLALVVGRRSLTSLETQSPTASAARTVTMVYVPRKEVTARSIARLRRVPPPRPPEAHPTTPPAPVEPAPPPVPLHTAVALNAAHPGMTARELPRVPDHDEPAAITSVPGAGATPTANRTSTERSAPQLDARATRELAMVNEARRLFGPHATSGVGMEGVPGPVARAGFPVYLPAGGRRCP